MGEALKANSHLLILDLSYNDNLDDELELHECMTDSIIASNDTVLQKMHITSSSVDVKAHYLNVIDHKTGLFVYVNEKILEDVDIQE